MFVTFAIKRSIYMRKIVLEKNFASKLRMTSFIGNKTEIMKENH